MKDDAIVNWDNTFNDKCKEKHVNIATTTITGGGHWTINNDTGEVVRTDPMPMSGWSSIPWEWEIYIAFYDIHNIIPFWKTCNDTWGFFHEERGRFTGAVGRVNTECVSPYLFLIILRLA